jgi:hypothetical protein
LRYLAGGSYLDITRMHAISDRTFYDIVEQTIVAILVHGSESMKYSFDLDDLIRKENRFARKSGGAFRGCIGALDGLCVQIERPHPRDCGNNPSGYYTRKGFYSLNIQVSVIGIVQIINQATLTPHSLAALRPAPSPQAVADADRRLDFVAADAQGSTHDSLAFKLSRLHQWLRSGRLTRGFWIAGDEAYECDEHLLTNFPKGGQDVWEDAFNAYLTQCRLVIECAFGIFVRRWGIFWRPLAHSPAICVRIVMACVALHNAIIDFRVACNPEANPEEARDVVYCQSDALCDYRETAVRDAYIAVPTAPYDGYRRDLEVSEMRAALKEHLARHSLERNRPLTEVQRGLGMVDIPDAANQAAGGQ